VDETAELQEPRVPRKWWKKVQVAKEEELLISNRVLEWAEAGELAVESV
jgi:hypothetical protein